MALPTPKASFEISDVQGRVRRAKPRARARTFARPVDTWPMLIAAGYLRRGLDIDTVARRTGLTVDEVTAIAHRLARADAQRSA